MNIAHTMKPHSSSIVIAFLLSLALHGEELPDLITTKTVELPAYTVTGETDLPKPESWNYAQIDGFEILSNASNKRAKDLLREFQLFRQALDVVRPMQEPSYASSSLILCGKRNDFMNFVPAADKGELSAPSKLLRNREQSAIVLNLYGRDIFIPLQKRSTRNAPHGSISVDQRRQLYRQYIHYQLPYTDSPPPAWLLEGTIQIILDLEFSEREIRFGRLYPYIGPGVKENQSRAMRISPNSPYSQLNYILQFGALLSMDELLSVTHDDPEAKFPIAYSLWAKQAYAFVHMCNFGSKRNKWRPRFNQFVSRLSEEPLSEKLFEECFGMNYKKMQNKLTWYARMPTSRHRHIKLAQGSELTFKDVEFREATQAEIARIKGDAQQMAGHHTKALNTFREAYDRGERDPELLAALGVAENHAGREDRARLFLEHAAKHNTHRPSAWNTLAQLRLDKTLSQATKDEKKLSASQMNTVLAPLLKALTLEVVLPETYHLIADAWENSSVQPTEIYAKILGQGALRFPNDDRLVYRASNLFAQVGAIQNAVELAQMGLRLSNDERKRKSFSRLIADLQSFHHTENI